MSTDIIGDTSTGEEKRETKMLEIQSWKCALLGAGALIASSVAVAAVQPVKLRWASDHNGPPHPAAIAEVYFAEQVEKRIPGSKVQIFWAKSLYTVPQGVKALTQGNLEVLTGQFGKTSSIEPLANVLLGAGKLTTVGAIDGVDTTKTFKQLAEHFDKVHDITIFGAGHLSMYMGAGAVKSRLVAPADFSGKKMRSMGPAENALLSALGANPQAMAFGDVPPALQTGVIDGLLTSLGGFNATKEQAPYFTVAGLNGIVGDYYWFGVSNRWWKRLSDEQREILTDIIKNDFIPFQRVINYCNDKRTLEKFLTDDKSAPGIYVLSEDEASVIKKAENGATNVWIKTKVNDTGDKLVDQFTQEAEALVKANPPGSHALEKTDCSKYEEYFARYGKGGNLHKAKSRK
ncbi:MAG: TRAP transporter substrate-binding protein [Hyphomicrobiaceae bacterium]